MRSTKYDSENTDNKVGLDLMASLSLSREQVGKSFHHSHCDSVYASPEDQVKSGGGLLLNRYFTAWCDVPDGSFSGNWDRGYKLQLVYGDVLLKQSNIKSLNKLVFGSMGSFVSGQAGLRFKELSKG